MDVTKRMSLNASLKEANIFADASSDDSADGTRLFQNIANNITIKKEPGIDDETTPESSSTLPAFTIKPDLIKKEMDTPKSSIQFTPIKIEKEEHGADFGIDLNLAEMALKTPIKNEDSPRSSSLKITTRSLLKQRNSPYMKEKEEVFQAKRMRRKIGQDEDDDRGSGAKSSKLNKKSMVSDPVVLARRQKQIDFGKNTIGYDNYVKQVPKDQRKPEDPATPNKYRVYSRRGFDGLIKQWRLKLHQYDDAP